MMGTVRRVCRNVKRWRNAAMALRWTAAGMMEAAKGFRRLKASEWTCFNCQPHRDRSGDPLRNTTLLRLFASKAATPPENPARSMTM
jgi:hypothetical protein